MKKRLVGSLIVSIVIILSCFYVFESKDFRNDSSTKEGIHSILDEFFKIEYGGEPYNYSSVVNNPEFVDMLILNQSRFKDVSKSNKEFKVEIDSIHEKEKDNYIVRFKVIKGENMDIKSEYTCLIQKEDDKYYINRLINDRVIQGKNPEEFIEDENSFNEFVQNFISSVKK